MPKPFPFPFNVGTDICKITRILRLVKLNGGNGGMRFARRILREDERAENKKRLEEPILRLIDAIRINEVIAWKKNHLSVNEGKERVEESSMPKKGKLKDVDVLLKLTEQNKEELRLLRKDLWDVSHFLAGRFAAKEAAIKAHPSRRLTYHDIAIRKHPENEYGTQAPIAVILPENGNWDEGQEVKISISHDGNYATATCLAYEPGPEKQEIVGQQQNQTPHHRALPRKISTNGKLEGTGPLDHPIPEDKYWRKDKVVVFEVAGFRVTTLGLESYFRACRGVLAVSVPVRPAGSKAGCGYVLFATQFQAAKAAKIMDGKILHEKVARCKTLE